jgi:hypothetical protein
LRIYVVFHIAALNALGTDVHLPSACVAENKEKGLARISLNDRADGLETTYGRKEQKQQSTNI